MSTDQIHVVPRDEDWIVKREGQDRAVSTHSTQLEAIEAGKKLAQPKEGNLIVHRQDGTFREVRNYS